MASHKLHVVIARLMELTSWAAENHSIEGTRAVLVTLYCFAPHFAAEYYQKLVGEDIREARWSFE
jgi:leucyl-tRNA synthetase